MMKTVKKDETVTTERNDFMFYETFKGDIDLIRTQDPAAAGKLCMAIFRLGVRREWTDDLPPEQKAFLKSIEPLMKRSDEKKKRKAKELARAKYWRSRKANSPSDASAGQKKPAQSRDDHDQAP